MDRRRKLRLSGFFKRQRKQMKKQQHHRHTNQRLLIEELPPFQHHCLYRIRICFFILLRAKKQCSSNVFVLSFVKRSQQQRTRFGFQDFQIAFPLLHNVSSVEERVPRDGLLAPGPVTVACSSTMHRVCNVTNKCFSFVSSMYNIHTSI